jgi:hypothetical protein
MKRIRFPIARLMAIVALAAVDLGAIRAALDDPGGSRLLLCTAALPMANLLAIGLLVGRGPVEGRRFLLGFEASGAAVLAFLIAAILSGEDWPWSYLTTATAPLRATLGPAGGGKWSPFRLLVARSLLALWATLPQLALALAGGLLFRKAGTAEWTARTRC